MQFVLAANLSRNYCIYIYSIQKNIASFNEALMIMAGHFLMQDDHPATWDLQARVYLPLDPLEDGHLTRPCNEV